MLSSLWANSIMQAVLKDNIILIYINRNIMSLKGEVIVLSILPLI